MVVSKCDFLKEGALIAEKDVRWDQFDQLDFQTWRYIRRESLRLPIEATVKKRRQGDNMGKPAGDLEG